MTALIAVNDVKTLLPFRQGNTSYDDRITKAIAAASALIEGECRQTFTKSERTESHTSRDTIRTSLNLYGDGCPVSHYADEQIVPLRGSPIDPAAPVTVRYDPARRFGDDTIIDPEFYTMDAADKMDRILLRFPTRYIRSGLRVTYTAGYAEADGSLTTDLATRAPDLWQAALLTSIHIFNRQNPDLIGTDKTDETKVTVAAGSKPNGYGIPAEAVPFLRDYRRVLTGRG